MKRISILIFLSMCFTLISFAKYELKVNGVKYEIDNKWKNSQWVTKLKINGKKVNLGYNACYVQHRDELDGLKESPYFSIWEAKHPSGPQKYLINGRGERVPIPNHFSVDLYSDNEGNKGILIFLDKDGYEAGNVAGIYDLNGKEIKTKLNNKYNWTQGELKFNIYNALSNKLVVSSDKLPYTKIEALEGNDDIIKVYKGEKKGLYNIARNVEILKPVYDYIEPFCEYIGVKNADKNLYRAGINKRFGLYNIMSPFDELLPYPADPHYSNYETIEGCKNIIKVYDDSKVGLFNISTNRELLKPECDKIEISKHNSDYLEAKKYNKILLYDIKTGKEVLPSGYSLISDVIVSQEGNTIVRCIKGTKYGLFDITSGREILSPEFEYAEFIPTNNMIQYKINGFYGVMDQNGKDIIPTNRGYTSLQYVSGLKKFTYSMSGYKGECDYLGKELSKIAVPVNNNSSFNSSNTSHTHNHSAPSASTAAGTPSKNQGNQVREYTETVPVQVWQPCGACNGSGQCQVCYGSGWTYSNSSYNGKKACSACHGTGKCTLCGGRGGQNVVRYEQRTVYR